MNTKELIKKAQLIAKLSWQRNWRSSYDVCVRNLYKKGVLTLENATVSLSCLEVDLKNIEFWSTYEACIEIDFEIESNIIYKVRCFDGDILHGLPNSLRWSAVFSGPLDSIVYFANIVNIYWKHFLEKKYEDDEVDRKKRRILEIEQQLLNM